MSRNKLIFKLIPVFFGVILGIGLTIKCPWVMNKAKGFLGATDEVRVCSCEENCDCDCGCSIED